MALSTSYESGEEEATIDYIEALANITKVARLDSTKLDDVQKEKKVKY